MLVVLGLLACTALLALAVLVAWPWRVDITLKAMTEDAAISVAGGVEVAGLSASAAAILGGAGVVAIHLRSRELWKRSMAHVSPLVFLDRLEERAPSPPKSKSKSSSRAKTWLLARTDTSALPELGIRVLTGLRDVSFHGALACAFSDPVVTGKAAAWLFPIAGVLAPFGVFDLTFDWSGRNRVDGAMALSFRVVPLRVALAGLHFARHHVHLFRARALPSSTLPTSITT